MKETTSVPATVIDIWQKEAEAMEALLYRAYEQADKLTTVAANLPVDGSFAGVDEEERNTRFHNARLMTMLLQSMWSHNSHGGVSPAQRMLLQQCGFILPAAGTFEVPATEPSEVTQCSCGTKCSGVAA